MRGVKAKRLRRIARQESAGMPERELLAQTHIITVRGQKLKQFQTHNNPKSTRGIYRGLKNGTLTWSPPA